MRLPVDGLDVHFPYDFVYREQYAYMLELKRALDASGDAALEMPTGTGKTVSLLALILAYQRAHPDRARLVYCTRTVPEMSKTIEEVKRVVGHRAESLAREAGVDASGIDAARENSLGSSSDFLAVCLSSRRNMCVNASACASGERDGVDAACRARTASWVRAEAEAGKSVETCSFFEGFSRNATEFDLRGIYDLDDIKALAVAKGWCPYYLVRRAIEHANVVVFSYQYLLDPKVAAFVTSKLDSRSIVVFDEAHNIDNVCIEALSVTLDRRMLEAAKANLNALAANVKRVKAQDAGRLQAEYARLVHGLGAGGSVGGGGGGAGVGTDTVGGGGADGEELTDQHRADPVLAADLVTEAIPAAIRNADYFVRFMRQIVRYLCNRIKVTSIDSVTPASFLAAIARELAIDIRPLRFAYTRLSSLMRTLQVINAGDFGPIHAVADFATLLATYPTGFLVLMEPYAAKTPHIPDPTMQLACLDASLAIKPVFQKFSSVILTSGTLSPIDMYPKILSFTPVVSASLPMSVDRPCILPLVVSRGADQTALSTKFELRDSPSVLANYGALLVSLARTVPDGLVAFFPSYAYMELAVSSWHSSGVLRSIESSKLLFMETKDIVETTLSLTAFRRACDIGRGAVFFSIARGKIAEGIDFDRHYGRAVVVFGIPYQYTLSIVLRARLAYLRDTFHIRENDFLTFDAIRQAAQCCGRIIRSKRDYGVIIFADERYARADKRTRLPLWIQQFLTPAHLSVSVDVAVAATTRFLKELAQPPAALVPGARSNTLLSLADVREMDEDIRRRSGGGGGFFDPGAAGRHALAVARVRETLGVGANLGANGEIILRPTGRTRAGAGDTDADTGAIVVSESDSDEVIDLMNNGGDLCSTVVAAAPKRPRITEEEDE